jgi:Tol biopolymer transport system component
MLDIAQGHVRRVTTKEGVSDNSPCWSPDSAHLVFLSSRSGSSQVRGPPCSDHSLAFSSSSQEDDQRLDSRCAVLRCGA